MSNPAIEERIIGLIGQYASSEVLITRGCRLGGDLGLDSLDTTELAMDLEAVFDTAISDEEFDRWSTVGDVIDFIEKHTADQWACRQCGCTDIDCSGCIKRTGEPCHWVERDLCSACADKR